MAVDTLLGITKNSYNKNILIWYSIHFFFDWNNWRGNKTGKEQWCLIWGDRFYYKFRFQRLFNVAWRIYVHLLKSIHHDEWPNNIQAEWPRVMAIVESSTVQWRRHTYKNETNFNRSPKKKHTESLCGHTNTHRLTKANLDCSGRHKILFGPLIFFQTFELCESVYGL